MGANVLVEFEKQILIGGIYFKNWGHFFSNWGQLPNFKNILKMLPRQRIYLCPRLDFNPLHALKP